MLSANAIDPSRLLEGEPLHDDYLMKPIDLRQLLKTIHALLNIEWIYDAEIARPSAPAAIPSAAGAPPSDDIDELIGLGEIGHVRRILEKLHEIENNSPNCGDFVAQMRSIVNAFDLKRYAAALEAIRDRRTSGNHA
jgi:hypothetical protein